MTQTELKKEIDGLIEYYSMPSQSGKKDLANAVLALTQKAVAQERKRTVEEIERIVKDEAQKHPKMKIGTSFFGYHYWICSELERLKSNLK